MKVNNIEKEIVEKFIKKSRQERIIYELGNPKKRDLVIWKFSGSEIFDEACLQSPKTIPSVVPEEYFRRLGRTEKVYFIGESYIGELTLTQAVNKVNGCERCIVYFGDGVGYYQGERECGKAPRFLLLNKE